MHKMSTAIQILKELIKYETITPKENGIYEYIKTLLKDFEYFETQKESRDSKTTLNEGEKYITKNIFLYKLPISRVDFLSKDTQDTQGNVDFTNYEEYQRYCFNNLAHFCFAGHVDVVSPGDITKWNYNPFEPKEFTKDSKKYINGRGTQDMKGGIAGFISAINIFLESLRLNNDSSCLDSNFIISVLLTSDEEGHGEFGTKHILEELKKKNMLPNYTIVAEPTSSSIAGDTIKIGRRGSINGKITIFGKQGHVAYPDKCINPIELIKNKLDKIAGINLCNGDDNFLPSKIVVTNINAGVGAVNVVPNDLMLMFNIRNSTKINIENIEKYFENILSGLNYEIYLTQSAEPFITNNEYLINLARESIKKISNVDAKLSTDGGTSDARFFAKLNIPTIELGVANDKIHAINEMVLIKQVQDLESIFVEILRGWSLR